MTEINLTDLSENLMNRLFNGVFMLNPQGSITLWNPAAERITGFRGRDLIGKKYIGSPVQHTGEDGGEAPAGQDLVLGCLQDGILREGRAYFKHAEGFRVPVAVRTFPLRDANGMFAGAAEIFTDNKSVIAALQSIQTSDATVLFDPLTGIGNRPHIEVKLRVALHALIAGGPPFGVLFMDIDHFKNFNDTYGHLTGDKVLRYVAQSIRNNLRVSDSCGRWGGEEFIALMMDVDRERLGKVAEKLRQIIAQTEVEDQDARLSVTISIGATLARPDDTLQSLIQRVDQLMYQSKENGRDQVTLDG
jgi:diguanylate cyclase (GGDEF)-like protein/PAS domain S-box-containing protein